MTGRYECSENLLDDRKESLEFITPLGVSFKNVVNPTREDSRDSVRKARDSHLIDKARGGGGELVFRPSPQTPNKC